MDRQSYEKLLRVLATVVAVVLWAASMNFSYDGFNFNVSNMEWVGVVLALSITAVELVWNKQGMNGNLTLLVGGLFSYIYGMYTNVAGVIYAQGYTGADVSNNPMLLVFPTILGIFLEVMPEPLFVWGLVGMLDGGDLLTNLFGKVNGGASQGSAPAPKADTPPTYTNTAPQPQAKPAAASGYSMSGSNQHGSNQHGRGNVNVGNRPR